MNIIRISKEEDDTNAESKGKAIAEFFGLKQKSDGTYDTDWGKKSHKALYYSTVSFMEKLEKDF